MLLTHHSLLTVPTIAGSTLLNGLLAYWDFDETTGNLINQLGDTNFNGTLVGGVTQNQAGKVGTSYLFNGTTGYINLSSETFDLSTTDFTIDCWINIPSVASGTKIFFDKRDSGSDGFAIYILANRPSFIFNSVLLNDTALAVTINTWYHFLFEADRDGNGKLYLNNSAGTPTSIAAVGNLNITAKARIGARAFAPISNFMSGKIDEMGIWNRLLTPAEKTARYNSGNGNTYPFS